MRWPARSLPWVALANVALARGDLPTAERNLREALRLEPTDVVARNNLTEVLATMGCPASARREFAAMPALAGDDPLAPAIESTARRVAGEGGSDAPGCPSAAATANSLP